jgi:hypothetical protein
MLTHSKAEVDFCIKGPSNYLDGYFVYLSIHFKHVIAIKWHVAGNHKRIVKNINILTL